MKPFRTSFTARAFTLAATIALVGPGVVATLALPLVLVAPILLAAIALSFVALGAGIGEHPDETMLLTVLSPLFLFFYSCAMFLVLEKAPNYGWALMVAGTVPLCLHILSLGSRQAIGTDKPRTQAATASQGA